MPMLVCVGAYVCVPGCTGDGVSVCVYMCLHDYVGRRLSIDDVLSPFFADAALRVPSLSPSFSVPLSLSLPLVSFTLRF